MASLELTNDTLQISLSSKHINITRYIDGTDCERIETVRVPLYDIDRVVVTGTPNITIPTLTSFMDEGIPVFIVAYKICRACIKDVRSAGIFERPVSQKAYIF